MKAIRVFLGAFAFLLISNSVFSQKVEFVEPRFNLEATKPAFFNYSVNNNHYYLLTSGNLKAPLRVDLQVLSYDSQGKPLNSFMIDKTMNPAEPNYFKGLFTLNNKWIFFKDGYDTKAKKTNLYFYELDDEGSKSEPTLLSSMLAEGAFNTGNYLLTSNPDNSKLVVISNLPREKNTNEKLILTVFDAGLNQIVSKKHELPFEAKKYVYNWIFINNDGMVFLLKKIYPKKGEPEKDMIFTFSPELELLNSATVNIGDLGVISSFDAKFDKEGNLVIGGLYYNFQKIGVNSEDPDGVFVLKCDSKGEVTSSFSKKHYFKSFKTNNLLIDNTGNYIVLIESADHVNEATGAGTNPVYIDNYTNQDAELVKFSNLLQWEWNYTIKRDELKSVNDNAKANRVWASVLPTNEIVVVYRDAWARHDGVNRTVITPPVIYWKGNVIETISQDGKQSKHQLITDARLGGKTGQYSLIPQSGYLQDGKLHFLSFRDMELVSTIIEI